MTKTFPKAGANFKSVHIQKARENKSQDFQLWPTTNGDRLPWGIGLLGQGTARDLLPCRRALQVLTEWLRKKINCPFKRTTAKEVIEKYIHTKSCETLPLQ